MGLWRTVTFAGKEREGGLGRGGGRRGQGWGDSAGAALARALTLDPPARLHTRLHADRRKRWGEQEGARAAGEGCHRHALTLCSPPLSRALPPALAAPTLPFTQTACVCARDPEKEAEGRGSRRTLGVEEAASRMGGAVAPLFCSPPPLLPPPPPFPPRSRPRLHRVLHLLPGQRAPARGGQAGPGVHKRAQQAVSVGGEAPVPPGRPPQGALKCREGGLWGGEREKEGRGKGG